MPTVRVTGEVVAMRPAPRSDTSAGADPNAGSDSQVTPLPTSPLALASDEPLMRSDATGSRPRPPKAAEVVPIRPDIEADSAPDQRGTRSTGSEPATSATPARAPKTRSEPPPPMDVDTAPTPSEAPRVDPGAATEPPFLASRSLAEDLEPSEPARKSLRRLGVTFGIVGGAGAALLGGMDTSSLAAAGGLLALAMIAALPLRYNVRALAISGLAATGLGFFSAGLRLHGERLDESLLAGAVFVLGAGLLFRAYHRASRMARLVVTLGILALGSYLFLSGGLGTLTHLDGAWQSWAPVVPRIMLALLGLTAILAYMDASSTAGGTIWASLLFLVFTAHTCVREAIRLFPHARLGRDAQLPDPHLGQSVAVLVVVIVGSIALAQLLAASAARRRRPTA